MKLSFQSCREWWSIKASRATAADAGSMLSGRPINQASRISSGLVSDPQSVCKASQIIRLGSQLGKIINVPGNVPGVALDSLCDADLRR